MIESIQANKVLTKLNWKSLICTKSCSALLSLSHIRLSRDYVSSILVTFILEYNTSMSWSFSFPIWVKKPTFSIRCRCLLRVDGD